MNESSISISTATATMSTTPTTPTFLRPRAATKTGRRIIIATTTITPTGTIIRTVELPRLRTYNIKTPFFMERDPSKKLHLRDVHPAYLAQQEQAHRGTELARNLRE